jgi:hypothetical protein
MSVAEYASLAAAVLPLVVAFLIQSNWSAQLKGIVAGAASVLAGVGSVYFGGGDLSDLAVAVPAILLASQVFYHRFFKPTGLAPWFEQFTNLATLLAKALASSPQETKPE